MFDDSPLDDFIQGMQVAVKREVVDNYFRERKLCELMIEDFRHQALAVGQIERRLALRYIRLYQLLIEREFLPRLAEIMGLDRPPYLGRFRVKKKYKASVLPFVSAKGMTNRGRYIGLIFKAYGVLYKYNDKYRETYEDLALEARAVNLNLQRFRTSYDLMAIIQFIRSLDVKELERRHFLGQNFTAAEMAQLERGLTFKDVAVKTYRLAEPQDLPAPADISHGLRELAREIFDCHREQACQIVAWRPEVRK